jgi:hypothetical protein
MTTTPPPPPPPYFNYALLLFISFFLLRLSFRREQWRAINTCALFIKSIMQGGRWQRQGKKVSRVRTRDTVSYKRVLNRLVRNPCSLVEKHGSDLRPKICVSNTLCAPPQALCLPRYSNEKPSYNVTQESTTVASWYLLQNRPSKRIRYKPEPEVGSSNVK